MKREVDYKKAWKRLRKWLWSAENVDGWDMYAMMTKILKQCTKKKKREE